MQNKYQSPNWFFEIDRIERYAFYESVFSPEECDTIIRLGKKLKPEKAEFLDSKNKPIKSKKVRDSNVSWIVPNPDTHWIFERVTAYVLDLNAKFFGFELTGMYEGLQFTNYKAPGGHYDYHIDKIFGGQIRKLSFSIQLNDPKDYEGGELSILESDKPEKLKKDRGLLIAFPSYSVHRVNPVTKGERNSLVGWISGPNFK